MVRLAYPAYRSMSGKVKLIQVYVGSVLLIYLCESCHLRISLGRTLLYDKVNRTCITFNVSFLNVYIMIPSHTGFSLFHPHNLIWLGDINNYDVT